MQKLTYDIAHENSGNVFTEEEKECMLKCLNLEDVRLPYTALFLVILNTGPDDLPGLYRSARIYKKFLDNPQNLQLPVDAVRERILEDDSVGMQENDPYPETFRKYVSWLGYVLYNSRKCTIHHSPVFVSAIPFVTIIWKDLRILSIKYTTIAEEILLYRRWNFFRYLLLCTTKDIP